MEWRWKDFEPEEVLSPGGMILYRRGVLPLQEVALDGLQRLRDEVGVILVNNGGKLYRGFRTPEEQVNVYLSKGREAVSWGFHVAGAAFDVNAPDVSFDRLIEVARRLGFRGIGRYPGFVHIDFRGGDLAEWREI